MKKLKLTSCGAAAALLLLASCDEGMDFGSGTGTISPLVSYDPTVVASRSAGSRVAEFDDLTVNDLTITLKSADGKVSQEFPYADFPVNQGFAVGKYTMTAYYGDSADEGFGKPAVFGSTELSVSEGKTTRVELTAKPSKAMVGISFDEDLASYMTNLSATLHTASGSAIDFAADETRYAYVAPGKMTLDVTFTKPNGKGGTLQVAEFQAEAQHRYNMSIALGGDGYGEVSSITIIFDETLQQENVTIDISDQVLSVPAPEVTLSGVAAGQVLNVVEGTALPSGLRYAINARGGIKSAVLTTTGQSLLDLGWPAEIDLANASAQEQMLLTDLGFKDLGILRNPGKMAAFELTDVVKHIPATVETASPVMFSLTVVDKNGKTSGEEPLGFGIKVDKLTLTMDPLEGYAYAGEETVDVQVTYNGTTSLQDLLTVKYLNESGIFKATTITNVAVKSRASQTYVVTVKVPSDAQLPVVLKAEAGSVQTGEVTIPTASSPVLAVTDNDVYARNAWASVSSPDYDCSTKTIELYVSTDGVNFVKATGTQSGADFHITGGLNPGTAYTLRAKVGALISNTVSITTEATAQIPGSNMDSWTNNRKTAVAVKADFYQTVTPWENNNGVTVSKMNAISTYSGQSAVLETSDSRSGSAAQVCTSGYGPSTNFSKPSAFVAGLLHNGENGSELTSRPSALAFWTKYTQYAADDYGYAEITVYDANGNAIATATKTVNPVTEYYREVVPINYKRNSAKAAKVKVLFKSTTASADASHCQNESGKHCYGARFYIDDVELVY